MTARHDDDVAEATAHERSRIAGELHDVVSHGLSVAIVQTVAAQMAVRDLGSGADPALDRHLDAVEKTAREGLADMRRMIDLLVPEPERPSTDPLAAPGDDGAPAPAVGLRELDGLVATARSAGLTIDLALATDGVVVPTGLGTTAYRIVQESLTNVLRHAPGAHVAVTVAVVQAPTRLSLRVRNSPAQEGPRPVHAGGRLRPGWHAPARPAVRGDSRGRAAPRQLRGACRDPHGSDPVTTVLLADARSSCATGSGRSSTGTQS